MVEYGEGRAPVSARAVTALFFEMQEACATAPSDMTVTFHVFTLCGGSKTRRSFLKYTIDLCSSCINAHLTLTHCLSHELTVKQLIWRRNCLC